MRLFNVILFSSVYSQSDQQAAVPLFQQKMVAAMDTCIEYMTAAMVCRPPKRKLEKVIEMLFQKGPNFIGFSIIIDSGPFSLMPYIMNKSVSVARDYAVAMTLTKNQLLRLLCIRLLRILIIWLRVREM